MRTFPSLTSLTPDERVWRLDWFGECAYPGSVRARTHPSIKVAISPLCCEPDDSDALLMSGCTDHSNQREIWLPITALPLLKIGDLWQDGHLIASPGYHVETFRNVRIETGNTSFIKAGLAIDGKFLIPLGAHPWHRRQTQAYCVAVSLADGRRLLVPCVEIIRFYFGSSSNLLQRLFCAPLTTDALWLSKSFDAATRHLHLVLGYGLSWESASDVARIAGSRFAWRAAAGIHASCQKATASGSPAYPYTGFPIEGSTDLTAHGVWLPFGDEPASTFLVYQLQSCSHAFPFRSLSYETPWRKDNGAGNHNGDEAQPPVRNSSRISARTRATDVDPSARKSQRFRAIAAKNRFPDLLRKSVWKDRIEDYENTDVFLLRSDGTLEQVAFGEPGGSSEVPGLDATVQPEVDVQPPSKPPLPHFVRKAIAQIRREIAENGDNDAKIQVICPAGRSQAVFTLPVVLGEDGAPVSEFVFSDEVGRKRQRRACFVEVIEHGMEPRLQVIIEGQDCSLGSVMTAKVPEIRDLVSGLLGLLRCRPV